MKKILISFLFITVTSALFAKESVMLTSPSLKISNPGVITGYVYDAYTGLGLDGAMVAAVDSSTLTLSDGAYTLSLEAGNFDLYFMKEGWVTQVIPGLQVADTLYIDATLERQPLGFPFTEDWSSGSFETNLWTFEPEQGNWQINDTIGNPEPSVIFTGDSATTDYSFTLVSHVIDATPVSQNIILSFDLMMLAGNYTGDEKLKVAIWNEEEWIQVEEYLNDTAILWETQNLNITDWAAGKLTKLKFEAAGQDASAIEAWGIDNIKLRTMFPSIDVNPSSFYFWAVDYFYKTDQMTISNTGDTTLEYSIDLDFNYLETCAAQGEFHHDSDWANNSIGTGGPVEFICAARFSSEDLGPYHFGYLNGLKIHIAQASFTNITLKVWKGGTYGDPGTEIYSKDVTDQINVAQWNNINLDYGIPIDANQEYWIGYFIAATGGHPASVDGGPQVPGKGAWLYFQDEWQELVHIAPTLNFNFCIRGVLGPYNWIRLDKLSGQLASGETDTINLIFENCGYMWGDYTEYIHITSNDPLQPLIIVPATANVGINEISDPEVKKFSVFPNPSNEFLTIESDFVLHRIVLHSAHGSLLIDEQPSATQHTTIDTRHLKPGVYLLTLISEEGQRYFKKIMVSR